MLILETLGPLVLLIALGSLLAHIRFLGDAFMADLNKLAFWIALPALLFTSAGHASFSGGQTWLLLGVLFVATLLITLIAWGVSAAMKLPRQIHGTLMQASFRGNLAYLGIPVIAYSFADPGMSRPILATAVIATVLLMALYNVLAVIVLQSSRPSPQGGGMAPALKSIARNPLLISGLLGLLLPLCDIHLPHVIKATLDSLGAAAVPIALLCIGGALRTTPLKGRRSAPAPPHGPASFHRRRLGAQGLPPARHCLGSVASRGPWSRRAAHRPCFGSLSHRRSLVRHGSGNGR